MTRTARAPPDMCSEWPRAAAGSLLGANKVARPAPPVVGAPASRATPPRPPPRCTRAYAMGAHAKKPAVKGGPGSRAGANYAAGEFA